jgi:hypothetical protein
MVECRLVGIEKLHSNGQGVAIELQIRFEDGPRSAATNVRVYEKLRGRANPAGGTSQVTISVIVLLDI